MAEYSCYLSNALGTRLADASNFLSLKYSRVVNDVGSLVIELPGDFDTQYIVIPDGRLEVWRRIDGGQEYLDTETTWFLKKLTQKVGRDGRMSIILEADTPLCLLREPGRFVNYAAGSAQAAYAAAAADDQIKQVVRENLGTSATGSRNISALLTIAGNLSRGQSVAKAFAWRNVLTVCQEFAQASTQAGTYLAFDVVAPTSDTLELRTYTGQRGVDHRFPAGLNPVILSPDMGNLGETELTLDYRDEVTYALAAGQGEGADRLTASAEDTARSGASPFGLREKFIQATQYSSATGLSSEADAAVRAGRPRTIFRAKLLDTPDTRYGVHWGWGDFVTAQAFDRLFDCRIDAISVSVSPGEETIEAWLRYDAS